MLTKAAVKTLQELGQVESNGLLVEVTRQSQVGPVSLAFYDHEGQVVEPRVKLGSLVFPCESWGQAVREFEAWCEGDLYLSC